MCGPFKSNFHFSCQNEISTPFISLFSVGWGLTCTDGEVRMYFEIGENAVQIDGDNTILRSLRL